MDEWDAIIPGAINDESRGRRVLLLDKSRKPGVKILMSGGTQCEAFFQEKLPLYRHTAGEASMWTVDREFDQPIRHTNLNMSGGSFVANLTLRLIPDLNEPGVSFNSTVTDPDATFYIPFVEQGVRNFVARRASEGVEIGHLRVTLTAITIHPVDAKTHRFTQAAEMAMAQGFDAVGVEL